MPEPTEQYYDTVYVQHQFQATILIISEYVSHHDDIENVYSV